MVLCIVLRIATDDGIRRYSLIYCSIRWVRLLLNNSTLFSQANRALCAFGGTSLETPVDKVVMVLDIPL